MCRLHLHAACPGRHRHVQPRVWRGSQLQNQPHTRRSEPGHAARAGGGGGVSHRLRRSVERLSAAGLRAPRAKLPLTGRCLAYSLCSCILISEAAWLFAASYALSKGDASWLKALADLTRHLHADSVAGVCDHGQPARPIEFYLPKGASGGVQALAINLAVLCMSSLHEMPGPKGTCS